MYSGTTFHHKSGSVFGVHQKIDKVAHTLFQPYAPDFFPTIAEILHFEGKNGPDGIKRKAPSKDEPWHFINPEDESDENLLDQIADHQINLKKALADKDMHRAAFEAAWLAHAVVDGLTPVHHYPLEEHLESMRGEGLETRDSIRKKLVIPGKTKRERLKNNWEFWGAKGVMTSHVLFELGVAGAITHYPKVPAISDATFDDINRDGFRAYYKQTAKDICELKMYESFIHKGWTPQLARQTRQRLIPVITQAVLLAWYEACS